MMEHWLVKGDDLEKIFYAMVKLLSAEDIEWLQEHFVSWHDFSYGMEIGSIREMKRQPGHPFDIYRVDSSLSWAERYLRNNYEVTLRIKEMTEAKMREKSSGGKTYWLSKGYLVKIAELLHATTEAGSPFTMEHLKETILQAVLVHC